MRACSRASANTFLRSATPENTAEIATNRSPTASASSRAIVVLPVPGGPHRIIDESLPAATMRPIAPSGPGQMFLADDLVEPARAQAIGERPAREGLGRDRGLFVGGKEIGHRLKIGARPNVRKVAHRRACQNRLKIYLKASRIAQGGASMFFHGHRHGRREHGHGRFGGGRGSWSRGPFTVHWEMHGDHHRGRGGRRRMFDGSELKLVLLKLIEESPRHGYDLIREIEERTGGAYAPSPGVIYPTLTMLDEMGLIEEQKTEGAKKQFAITVSGQAYLTEREEEVEALFTRLAELGSMRARSSGGPIRRAMGNLRSALQERLGGDDVDADVLHEIAAILDEAVQKIERLK